MGSDKIKIKDIEGTQDEVLGFFKNSGLDIGDYLNSAKSIKIPLCTIICASIVFLLSICIADRKSTRLNSSHANISYAVFCLKKKKLSYASSRTSLRITTSVLLLASYLSLPSFPPPYPFSPPPSCPLLGLLRNGWIPARSSVL